MSNIENRIQNIRQSIMKHAVAMKEKAKKQRKLGQMQNILRNRRFQKKIERF